MMDLQFLTIKNESLPEGTLCCQLSQQLRCHASTPQPTTLNDATRANLSPAILAAPSNSFAEEHHLLDRSIDRSIGK
jgi:hypothetical protein